MGKHSAQCCPLLQQVLPCTDIRLFKHQVFKHQVSRPGLSQALHCSSPEGCDCLLPGPAARFALLQVLPCQLAGCRRLAGASGAAAPPGLLSCKAGVSSAGPSAFKGRHPGPSSCFGLHSACSSSTCENFPCCRSLQAGRLGAEHEMQANKPRGCLCFGWVGGRYWTAYYVW